MLRPSLRSLAAVGLVGGLAITLGGCSTLSVSSNPETIPTTASATPQAKQTSSPTASASPTRSYVPPTAKPTPTATKTKTKVKAVEPLFVASLPSTVNAVVGQRIVVQFAADPEDSWTASGSGGVSVGAVKFNGPPPEQPDAPGTTIATLTATAAGTATVTFTSGKGVSKKLTVRVK